MKCHVLVIEQVSMITVLLIVLIVMLRDRQRPRLTLLISHVQELNTPCSRTLVVQRSVNVLDEPLCRASRHNAR